MQDKQQADLKEGLSRSIRILRIFVSQLPQSTPLIWPALSLNFSGTFIKGVVCHLNIQYMPKDDNII